MRGCMFSTRLTLNNQTSGLEQLASALLSPAYWVGSLGANQKTYAITYNADDMSLILNQKPTVNTPPSTSKKVLRFALGLIFALPLLPVGLLVAGAALCNKVTNLKYQLLNNKEIDAQKEVRAQLVQVLAAKQSSAQAKRQGADACAECINGCCIIPCCTLFAAMLKP